MSRRRVLIDKNFVCGRIIGGLGNQFFIIFATISHSIDNQLDFFVDSIEKTRKTYFDTPVYKNLIQKKLPGKIYQEKYHHYVPIPKEKNLVLSGYFQSYKYFHHNIDKILRILEFSSLIDETRKKYLDYLDNDIVLHFRLGDYKKLGHAHPICDISYYKEALKHFYEKSKVLYFFEQEDRDIVTNKIKDLQIVYPYMIFTPIDTQIVDYEQVFLMSCFKNFIIANSSFSWWGAYLSQTREKVIYPSKWFCGILKDKKVDDMFLEDWIKI